jgi:hypothetical protein
MLLFQVCLVHKAVYQTNTSAAWRLPAAFLHGWPSEGVIAW